MGAWNAQVDELGSQNGPQGHHFSRQADTAWFSWHLAGTKLERLTIVSCAMRTSVVLSLRRSKSKASLETGCAEGSRPSWLSPSK